MSNNGRHLPDDETAPQEGSDEYAEALLLEDLESLREEMDEAGVDNIEQARHWIDQPAADQQMGVPTVADRATLEAVIEMMVDLAVTNRDELDQRIRRMQDSMGWD